MRLLSTFFVILLLQEVLHSQTGPGGVGNSSSNLFWLSSDQITGLSDGNNIPLWTDLSGNSNDLTQPNTSFTPTYHTNIVNGKPVVRFSKTNGRLRRTGLTTFPTTSITGIYVNINNGESSDGLLSYASSGHNNDFLLFSSNNLRVYRRTHRTSGQVLNDNSWHIAHVSWQSTGGELEVWKDGTKGYTTTGHNSGTSITTGGCLSLAGEQDAIDASYDASQTHFGDFTEVIIFNTNLNETQHVIIANYLSAKYNINLASNNIYSQDMLTAGDYDHEVAGIGRINSSDLHNDAQGSGIVRILNPSNLNDEEFLIWGHDNGALGTNGSTDFPTTMSGRLQRVWRVSEVNRSTLSSADVGSIDIRFDLSGLGPITTSDLRLLIDTDNDGLFSDETPIFGATSIGGGIYEFSNQSGINDNLRFTVGTINTIQTPLPIELINFEAKTNRKSEVNLLWVTASETDNDYFTIEHSVDANSWKTLSKVDGAGNSSNSINYSYLHNSPTEGVNYYRIKQTDFNGEYYYSKIKAVKIKHQTNQLHIYPNPTENNITIYSDIYNLNDLVLYNSIGKKISISDHYEMKSDFKAIINLEELPKGVYFLISRGEKKKIIKI